MGLETSYLWKTFLFVQDIETDKIHKKINT